MAYIEITCIEIREGGQVCGRFLGDMNENNIDDNFRCPRCRIVWNVKQSPKGVLTYKKLNKEDSKKYLENIIRIEERLVEDA